MIITELILLSQSWMKTSAVKCDVYMGNSVRTLHQKAKTAFQDWERTVCGYKSHPGFVAKWTAQQQQQQQQRMWREKGQCTIESAHWEEEGSNQQARYFNVPVVDRRAWGH